MALASRSLLTVPEAWSGQIPAARHPIFIAVWFAHGGSYATGLIGGGAWVHSIWVHRGRPPVMGLVPRTRGAWLRATLLGAGAAAVVWWRIHA